MNSLDRFFQGLWNQYIQITPQAEHIHNLLTDHDEIIVNDHVAFRTFSQCAISLKKLEPLLLEMGYEYFDEYHFKNKNLYARSYVHPKSDAKIFLSELLWQELSLESEEILLRYINQIPVNEPLRFDAGRLWPMPSYEEYLTLQEESEYAAWMLTWGLRANHFTIYVNHLRHFNNLEKMVSLLENKGYALNQQGGVIKGHESHGLKQASTMADTIEKTFACGTKVKVSSCYYEFAQRFNLEHPGRGEDLYQGFVVASADNIFESTSSTGK